MAMCRIQRKAFDENIITIDPDEKIILLSTSAKKENRPGAQSMFHQFENEPIFTPEKIRSRQRIFGQYQLNIRTIQQFTPLGNHSHAGQSVLKIARGVYENLKLERLWNRVNAPPAVA